MWRVGVIAVVASCYRPTIVGGSPCGANGACPAPLVCAATGTCELTEVDAPRAIDAAKADAHPDAIKTVPPDAPPSIEWKSTSSQTIAGATPAASVTIAEPTGAAAGDVMIATVAMGNTGEATVPAFTPPTGWTLIRQVNDSTNTALAVFWHAVGANEPTSDTFTFNESIEGVAWISLYSGVSTTAPIDIENGALDSASGTGYNAPPVATTVAHDRIVVAVVAHASNGTSTTWSVPGTVATRVDVNNGTTRSGVGFDQAMAQPGTTPAYLATASVQQDYALVEVLALRP